MRKYSKEWKEKKQYWIQKHGDTWKIHYIQNDCEYSMGEYQSKKEALLTLNGRMVTQNKNERR